METMKATLNLNHTGSNFLLPNIQTQLPLVSLNNSVLIKSAPENTNAQRARESSILRAQSYFTK